MSEARWDIPPSWIWASMGEISDVVGGGTPATSDDGNFTDEGIAWLTPADLTGYKETYVARGRRDLSDQGYCGSAARVMPAGTVLFSSRAPIGYCAIASGKISTNQGFKSFVLKSQISPEYVRYYLLGSVGYAESKASGTTFKELSGSRAAELAAPIAPLSEQRRIVAKIDSLSAKSKRARDHLDHIPRLVEKYKQAILAAAYEARLLGKPPASLRYTTVDTVVAVLDQGWSPKCESEAASNPNDWAIIKTTAIQPIHFNDCENKRLPKNLSPRPQITIERDDVLITRAGPRSRVAITCVVKQTRQRLMLCDKAYRLKVNDQTDAAFLALMLNAPQSLEALERMKTGISDSGLNLTQEKFLGLAIPDFTLMVQREIVRRVEIAFAWIDRLAAEVTNARKLIDHLNQSILVKAFRGDLVPQDPADEPASVLLERIRAGRADATPVKRGIEKANKHGVNTDRTKRTMKGNPNGSQ